MPFAASLIKQTGLKNLRLQRDLYHAQILHGDITTMIERLLPMIGHIQIASVPSRHEPMRREVNDASLFALLDRLGYEGFIGCDYHPEAGPFEGLGWFEPYRHMRQGGFMLPMAFSSRSAPSRDDGFTMISAFVEVSP